MPDDRDAQEEIPEAVLEEWYALHDGRVDGVPAGLGVQARDRTIRKLIDELRRLRRDRRWTSASDRA